MPLSPFVGGCRRRMPRRAQLLGALQVTAAGAAHTCRGNNETSKVSLSASRLRRTDIVSDAKFASGRTLAINCIFSGGAISQKKIRRQADEFTALRFRRVGWRAFSTKPDVTSSLGRLDLP